MAINFNEIWQKYSLGKTNSSLYKTSNEDQALLQVEVLVIVKMVTHFQLNMSDAQGFKFLQRKIHTFFKGEMKTK